MPARPRRVLLALAAGIVAAGLLVATRAAGPLADPTGDALYAALVFVLVLLVVPRVAPWRAAGVATAVCVAVELAQLTGAPAALVQAVPVSRFVVGTTFVPVDLLAYAAGAGLAMLVDVAAPRMVRRSREGRPTR